jgi:putative membrane protein insertion efficiency factor
MDVSATEAPPTAPEHRPSPLARLFMLLIGLYQRTALVRAPRCRFHPTCSAYALESVRVHGAVRGLGYAIARVARCHPWHPGGLDPVKPPRPRKNDT